MGVWQRLPRPMGSGSFGGSRESRTKGQAASPDGRDTANVVVIDVSGIVSPPPFRAFMERRTVLLSHRSSNGSEGWTSRTSSWSVRSTGMTIHRRHAGHERQATRYQVSISPLPLTWIVPRDLHSNSSFTSSCVALVIWISPGSLWVSMRLAVFTASP
jgi:hypothetical protein